MTASPNPPGSIRPCRIGARHPPGRGPETSALFSIHLQIDSLRYCTGRGAGPTCCQADRKICLGSGSVAQVVLLSAPPGEMSRSAMGVVG